MGKASNEREQDNRAPSPVVSQSPVDMVKRFLHSHQRGGSKPQDGGKARRRDFASDFASGVSDFFGPRQRSKTSLQDKVDVAATTTSSKDHSQPQERVSGDRPISLPAMESHLGTEFSPQIKDFTARDFASGPPPPSSESNGGTREAVSEGSGYIVIPSQPTSLLVDLASDHPHRNELGTESSSLEIVNSSLQKGPTVHNFTGGNAHQLEPDGESSLLAGMSSPSLGDSTTYTSTADHPHQLEVESQPVVVIPTPSPPQPESTATLIQKFKGYKLETKFHSDYVIHKTDEWKNRSSNRSWETSTWKKKGKIGSGSFGSVWLQEKEGGRKGKEQLRAVKMIPRDPSQGTSSSQELLALVKLKDVSL